MLTASIDTRGLDFVLNGVKDALVGSGGDVSTLVKDESRLLALGISKVAGPKGAAGRKKTGERIARSFRSKFEALSQEQGSNEKFAKGKPSQSGIVWYRTDSKFLYGAAPDSDMRHVDPQVLVNIYHHTQKIQGKTRIVVDFKEPRKSQRVAILTRVLTTKKLLNQAIAIGKLAIGKLQASWFATAKQIEPSLVGPNFIERHLKGNRTTKSITNLSEASHPETPSVTFGSKAVGVRKFERVVQFAINLRKEKLKARLHLILSGYSKDVAEGIRVQRHAHKVKGHE